MRSRVGTNAQLPDFLFGHLLLLPSAEGSGKVVSKQFGELGNSHPSVPSYSPQPSSAA